MTVAGYQPGMWVPQAWSGDAIQALDISTTSNVYADMGALSVTNAATVAGQRLLYWFESTTFVPSAAVAMRFRVLLDGIVQKGRSTFIASSGANCMSIVGRTAVLAAGSHTVKVQWCNSDNATTVYCRPATLPTIEGATLMAMAVDL